MHFLLGGIGGIDSQVSEVLYAGDVDVAGGNLYPVFVSEYKCVVVSLCRVGSDDSHLQVGDVGDGNGNIFGDMVGIEKFDYENLTNGSMYWTTSGYSTTFPYNKLYMDINVVSNTYSFYGNTYLSSKSYYYNDAVTHRQGLGFRGFRKITMHDNMKLQT